MGQIYEGFPKSLKDTEIDWHYVRERFINETVGEAEGLRHKRTEDFIEEIMQSIKETEEFMYRKLFDCNK